MPRGATGRTMLTRAIAPALLLISVSLCAPRVSRAAHGDNIACQACATMMEHAYQAMASFTEREGNLISLTERKDMELDIAEIIRGICKTPEFMQYTRRIRANCNQIDSQFPGVVARAYAGEEPIEAQQYNKTRYVCVKVLDYCDDDRNSVVGFANDCETCKAVVKDMEAVMYRSKESDFFRSTRHVYSVLDAACSSLVLRAPPAILRPLTDMCEDLVSDHEHEIAQALMRDPVTAGRMVCGPQGVGHCPAGHENYETVWTSIFHQKPWDEDAFKSAPNAEEL